MYLFYRAKNNDLILVKEDTGDALEEHLKRLDLMGFDLNRVVISNTWISTYNGNHDKRYHSIAVNHAISVILMKKEISDSKIKTLVRLRVKRFIISKYESLINRCKKMTGSEHAAQILIDKLNEWIKEFHDLNTDDLLFRLVVNDALEDAKWFSRFISKEITEWRKSKEPMISSKA